MGYDMKDYCIVGIYDSAYYWEVLLPDDEFITRTYYNEGKYEKNVCKSDIAKAVSYPSDIKEIKRVITLYYPSIKWIYIVDNGEIENLKIISLEE